MVKRYLVRVLTRPVPWLLHYLVLLLPALVLAPLLTAILLPWIDVPLFTRALETRSLGLLIELFSAPDRTPPSWALLVGLGGVVVAWGALQLVWLWLHGATLSAYAAEQRLGLREFFQGGNRWFGVLFLLSLLNGVGIGGILSVAVALIAFTFTRFPALVWGIGGVSALLGGALAAWTETARVAAVAQDDPDIIHALRAAFKLAMRRPLPWLGLLLGGLAAYGALFLAHRQLVRWIPIHWWLLSFGVQQGVVLLRQGVRLTRQAGLLGLFHSGERE